MLVSVIVPIYNESEALRAFLPRLLRELNELAGYERELILVDDGSVVPVQLPEAQDWVRIVRHPVNLGNGAAVRTGIRQAKGECCVVLDGDGQHDPAEIPKLLESLKSFHLAVGNRDFGSTGAWHRSLANRLYSCFATYVAEYPIRDLTSGFRAFRRAEAMELIHLFPNRFSYPTTMTLGMIRLGYPVQFVPIQVSERTGTSKIRIFRDGLRFFIIIMKIGTLFSPMRLFLPVALSFALAGAGIYVYVLQTANRYSVWAAVLFCAAVTIFMIGLVAEEISSLKLRRNS